jgi:hypothetical protein
MAKIAMCVPRFVEVKRGHFLDVGEGILEATADGPSLLLNGVTYRLEFDKTNRRNIDDSVLTTWVKVQQPLANGRER